MRFIHEQCKAVALATFLQCRRFFAPYGRSHGLTLWPLRLLDGLCGFFYCVGIIAGHPGSMGRDPGYPIFNGVAGFRARERSYALAIIKTFNR